MKSSWVCVDSSVVVKLVVEEPYSRESRELFGAWIQKELEIAAPTLLRYEVCSVLRKHVARGLRTLEESREALERALSFKIHHPDLPDLHRRAMEMSHRLNRPTAYDAHYLALAEYLSCEFHTADERLVNAVAKTLPWVKWAGKP